MPFTTLVSCRASPEEGGGGSKSTIRCATVDAAARRIGPNAPPRACAPIALPPTAWCAGPCRVAAGPIAHQLASPQFVGERITDGGDALVGLVAVRCTSTIGAARAAEQEHPITLIGVGRVIVSHEFRRLKDNLRRASQFGWQPARGAPGLTR